MYVFDMTFFFIIVPIFAMVGLGCFILWVWMLVECALYEPAHDNNKLVWIVIIIFTNVIGALIYLIARRPQRVREVGR